MYKVEKWAKNVISQLSPYLAAIFVYVVTKLMEVGELLENKYWQSTSRWQNPQPDERIHVPWHVDFSVIVRENFKIILGHGLYILVLCIT